MEESLDEWWAVRFSVGGGSGRIAGAGGAISDDAQRGFDAVVYARGDAGDGEGAVTGGLGGGGVADFVGEYLSPFVAAGGGGFSADWGDSWVDELGAIGVNRFRGISDFFVTAFAIDE